MSVLTECQELGQITKYVERVKHSDKLSPKYFPQYNNEIFWDKMWKCGQEESVGRCEFGFGLKTVEISRLIQDEGDFWCLEIVNCLMVQSRSIYNPHEKFIHRRNT